MHLHTPPLDHGPFYQSAAWKVLRLQALARDHYRCVWCGANVRGKGLARVDHIEPVRLRPDLALSLDNLRTLCAPCDNRRHSEKGGKVHEPVDLNGYPAGWQ